ncbi:hypothetical protein [Rhodopila sp.]|uniref:hypothetical protein n=1 Tax=Rhodopila sp. TaxID=2480087 RepID=UPI003D10C75B
MAAPMEQKVRKNNHDIREVWQRQAIDLTRPIFEESGYRIAENIIPSFGFPSGGKKSKVVGEWIGPEATGGPHEVIIRSAIDDPCEIICAMLNQLIHTITGPERNKAYRDIALSIGMDVSAGLKNARPKPHLQTRLDAIAKEVGPIPHQAIDYDKVRVKGATNRPPKQGTRMLRAECVFVENEKRCGYLVRVSAEWARVGPPGCPKHGPTRIEWPDGEQPEQPSGPFTIDGAAEEIPTVPRLEAAE